MTVSLIVDPPGRGPLAPPDEAIFPSPAIATDLPFADRDATLLRALQGLGQRQAVWKGEPLDARRAREPGLAFVVEGVGCRLERDTGLCLGLVHPGEVLSVDPDTAEPGRWLTDATLLQISAADLDDALGVDARCALYADMAARRIAALEAQIACLTRHQASQRLATWLLSVMDMAGVVRMNQAELAVLCGLQRTSVCAALGQLRRAGGVKVTRGRIIARDRDALAAAACGCAGPGETRPTFW